MEQSPSWDANNSSVNHEIPSIVLTPKGHHSTHKSPQLVPVLSQFNLVHDPTSYFFMIHLNIILPYTLKSSKWSLSFRFPQQNHVRISCLPIRSTCTAHLILHNFITRIIFGDEYRSWSSLLCRLLHSPVTSSFLGPNILLRTLFTNSPKLRCPLNVSDHVSHPYRTTGKIIFLYILIFTFLDSKKEDKDST